MIDTNAIAAARLRLVELEKRLPDMTDAEVRRALLQSEDESEEQDLLAGEAERRDLDF